MEKNTADFDRVCLLCFCVWEGAGEGTGEWMTVVLNITIQSLGIINLIGLFMKVEKKEEQKRTIKYPTRRQIEASQPTSFNADFVAYMRYGARFICRCYACRTSRT